MTRAIAIGVLGAAALIGSQRSVTGRVVADAGGAPIANARVLVSAAGHSSTIAVTDGDGIFSFIPPDRSFTLTAVKSGYVQRQTTVAASAVDVEMRLVRSCVVSGRVIDASGEPVVGAIVSVMPAPSDRGPSRPLGRSDTDEAGEFRIAGIPPASVIVAAVTNGGNEMRQVAPNQTILSPRETTTYYPRATEKAQAEVIALRPGDERSDVAFVVGTDQGGFNAMMSAFVMRAPIQPQAPQGTGTISGRVLTIDGRPLAAAVVRLVAEAGSPWLAPAMRTDSAGRFSFKDLAAGRYRVAAGKPGFTAAADTTPTPAPMMNPSGFGSSTWIEIEADESRQRVDVELVRLGSVAGLIVDELGEPVQGASVQLFRIRYERGRRRLAGAAPARVTDDRGRYRIRDVPRGRFAVTASVGGVGAASLPGYARTYYPGTIDPRSVQFISVASSQDLVGIDIALIPVRTARVAGSIVGRDGQPTMGGTLQLRPNAAAGEVAAVPVGANINRDGTFEFPNVPPGSYLIYADKGRQQTSTEGDFSTMPVDVNGDDITGLAIAMPPGSTIAGRVAFDTADRDRLPPLTSIEIRPVPVDPDLAPSSIADPGLAPDGTFAMYGITGVRRLLPTRMPPGWTLKEVRVNGIDATDRFLTFGRREHSLSDVEIVLTDRVGDLAGTAVDADGRVVPGAAVIVMPIDRGLRYGGSRYLRRASPAADGSFKIASLAPGVYYVAAVRSTPLDGEDAWQDPAFLESLTPIATTLTVRESEAQTLVLRVPPR